MKHGLKRLLFSLGGRALTVIPQKVPVLFSGLGAVRKIPGELATLKVGKPLIITDAGVERAGILAKLTEILKSASIPYAVFSGITPDPTFEVCEKALEALRVNSCDSVIALGGGSVMDAGKLVRMGATHKKPLARFAGLLRCRNRGLPFICIPTTAGTGSEATAAAVITDSVKHRKVTVLDPRLPPDSTILDPALTAGLPPALTAATGIDALTHAIEAYCNTLHYRDVDVQALEAARLIFANLPRAYADGSDLEARENMLKASHIAGRAFTRGFVGYVHAVAHRFGEKYHVPHGLANAIALPWFLDFYVDVCPERLADLADMVLREDTRREYTRREAYSGEAEVAAAPETHQNSEPRNPEFNLRSMNKAERRAWYQKKARAFCDAVKALELEIGIPGKGDFIRAEDIDSIAEGAIKEAHGTPYPVPAVLDADDLKTLIRKMMK